MSELGAAALSRAFGYGLYRLDLAAGLERIGKRMTASLAHKDADRMKSAGYASLSQRITDSGELWWKHSAGRSSGLRRSQKLSVTAE